MELIMKQKYLDQSSYRLLNRRSSRRSEGLRLPNGLLSRRYDGNELIPYYLFDSGIYLKEILLQNWKAIFIFTFKNFLRSINYLFQPASKDTVGFLWSFHSCTEMTLPAKLEKEKNEYPINIYIYITCNDKD